jgi:5-bromo-4-chloroindolyl phosphate hydrolysis protein
MTDINRAVEKSQKTASPNAKKQVKAENWTKREYRDIQEKRREAKPKLKLNR